MARSRDDWVRAASEALRRGGVEAVRIEALARDLGLTKGSFYWHFADRAELLDALLSFWEEETRWLIGEARKAGAPRARLLRFFRLISPERGFPPDAEVFAWARRDASIGGRVEATESARVGFIREELEAAGLPSREAARRAEMAYMATQGWIERASRNAERYASLPSFTQYLFDLVLALPATDGAEAGPVDRIS